MTLTLSVKIKGDTRLSIPVNLIQLFTKSVFDRGGNFFFPLPNLAAAGVFFFFLFLSGKSKLGCIRDVNLIKTV